METVSECMNSQARAHQLLALGGPNVCQGLRSRQTWWLPTHTFFAGRVQFCWVCICPDAQGQWPFRPPGSESELYWV